MEAKPKHKVPAVSNDTFGGKSAMSKMNPQKPDTKKPEIIIAIKPQFRGITHKE
jgi:hypothetical protein